MLRVAHDGGPVDGFVGSPAVPRLRRDFDQKIPVVLAKMYRHDHSPERGFDLFEELDDGTPARFQFPGHPEDRGGAGGVAFDLDGTGMLFRHLFYAFFGRLFPASPEHPGSPPHRSANQLILTSAEICWQRFDTLTLPDAKFARTTPSASRAVDGERERHLAGPDGVPPLRGRPKTGRYGGPCPLQKAFRWPVLEPALTRLRDRKHYPQAYRLRRRGRSRRRAEREERRHPRRPYLGGAGKTKSGIGEDASCHPRRGTLGTRWRG